MVRPVGHHLQVIGHVAGMASFGVLGSMLFAVGIEVSAGGLEIRPIAFRILMYMDGMLAFGKIHQVQLDLDPVACGSEDGRSRILTLAGLEVHFHTLVLPSAAEADSANKAGSALMHTLGNLVICSSPLALNLGHTLA